MQKLIRNEWRRDGGRPYATARILRHDVHPEGFDVERIRFAEAGTFAPEADIGHIVSMVRGRGVLEVAGEDRPLQLQAGVHLYVPPGRASRIAAEASSELVCVSSPAAEPRGRNLLLRDEMFLAACSAPSQSLRWILTPQYLSRRVFLHHDETLVSKSGHPVSWFHTTMFDVAGLPPNQEGKPVFKMSYNSKTEFNVCYDVAGEARVRMAVHPYGVETPRWDDWMPLDGESTYHLNEAAGGPEEERFTDDATGAIRTLRNRHEVSILEGHVSLFCMFDPAPAGIERHRPGEYSDYEPLSGLLGTSLYESYRAQVARYDEMVDRLSLARARGELSAHEGSPLWELYLSGRDAQLATEDALIRQLTEDGKGRERILARWLQPAPPR